MPFDLPRSPKGLRFPEQASQGSQASPLGKPRPRRAAPAAAGSTRDLYELERAPQRRPAVRTIALSPDVDPEDGIATTAMERDAADVLPGASRRHRTESVAPAMPIPNFRPAYAPAQHAPLMFPPPPRQEAPLQAAAPTRELRAPLVVWLALALVGALASYFITPLAVGKVAPAFATRHAR